jgi:lauroyl/myristoyl acyltransferase
MKSHKFVSQSLRRAATQLLVRHATAATTIIPIEIQHPAVSSLVSAGAHIPVLRRMVRENMCLALGNEISRGAEGLYFRRLGWLLSRSLSTFNRGVAATPVLEEVKFDDSVHILDEAVAEGRGVVITSPHWSGHELVAATVARRHPLTMLVRQAPTAQRQSRKLKWYDALGAEIILRPPQASSIKDAVAYMSVLKRGKVLAITPDLLVDSASGIETRIFGRTATLPGGAFALALAQRAPMVRPYFRWQSDASVLVAWERAPELVHAVDRDSAVRAAIQDWCTWFEKRVEESPENWLFWLDKRWARFWRASPREVARQ